MTNKYRELMKKRPDIPEKEIVRASILIELIEQIKKEPEDNNEN